MAVNMMDTGYDSSWKGIGFIAYNLKINYSLYN